MAMEVNPYLNFNGNCEEAFNFYAKTFGGKILFKVTHGDTPDGNKIPELKDKIMHATLQVGDRVIMGSDAPPQYYSKPQGVYVSLNVKKVAESERVYKALAENAAHIELPLGETFWAERFGMLTDRYGIPWMINCEGVKAKQSAA
jgi:PhnB protein